MSFAEQLFGCFSDVFSLIVVLNLPFGACVIHSMATNQVTNKGFLRACVYSLACCFGMSANRQEIKKKMNLKETFCEDCLIYLFCTPCAAAQDFREAENRYLANP